MCAQPSIPLLRLNQRGLHFLSRMLPSRHVDTIQRSSMGCRWPASWTSAVCAFAKPRSATLHATCRFRQRFSKIRNLRRVRMCCSLRHRSSPSSCRCISTTKATPHCRSFYARTRRRAMSFAALAASGKSAGHRRVAANGTAVVSFTLACRRRPHLPTHAVRQGREG